MEQPKTKRIALIVASKGFRDSEYFIPKTLFEREGFEVNTVSDKAGLIEGADGGEAAATQDLKSFEPEEFDAVIFIGGPGAMACLDNEISYSIARKTVSLEKILGAICIAPSILAKAGVLDKKRATVWSSQMDKSQAKLLVACGAAYESSGVVSDGNIITAPGPAQAQSFAEKILDKLK